VAAQTLLTTNQFGNFLPGEIDGDYGQLTSDAVQRAKLALGFPQAAINGTYGPVLAAYLSGTRPLPAGYLKSRQQRLAAGSGEDKIRAQIVQWGQWGVTNAARIGYTMGSSRLSTLGTPGALPLSTDCSGFVTLCYAWSGAPNPNFPGRYDAAQGGYTGTLLNQCKQIPQSAAKAGDIVVWKTTKHSDGVHASLVLQPGADPWLINHGDDSQPKKIRFSQEDAGQRQRDGSATAVFLSAF
jgi:cell wall-associated NlpC family hydrolase